MPKNLVKLLTAHITAHTNGGVVNNRLADLMEKMKKKWEGPFLYHGGDDYPINYDNGNSVRWYVYYRYIDPVTGKMTRQKNIYLHINKNHKTKKERLKWFGHVMAELEWMLENGYSPCATENTHFTTGSLLDFALGSVASIIFCFNFFKN